MHQQRWNTEADSRTLLILAGLVFGLILGLLMFAFVLPVLGLGLITLVVLVVVLALTMPRGMDATRPAWHHHEVPDYDRLLRSVDATRAARHHHEVPDYEKRSMGLGSAILLLAAVSIIAYSVPGETYQKWAAVVATPEPRDCDWTSSPFGDKHCHYEPVFRNIIDQNSKHITVTWHRVDDFDW
jgi:multisubunit Na+/H+ antiporter MnhG subunit